MDITNNDKIIAAVRSRQEFERALSSKQKYVFLLSGTILELPLFASMAKEKQKNLFVHIDMIDGLGKDIAALEFISRLGFYGVISTRANIIKQAKNLGLYTVQRFFIVDGQSVKTALDTLHQTKPTYAEIMPGLIYKEIAEFSMEKIPIIAGGLINTKEEAEKALNTGAFAVSTSQSSLWQF